MTRNLLFQLATKRERGIVKVFSKSSRLSTVPFGDQAKPKITFYCTTGFKAFYAVNV